MSYKSALYTIDLSKADLFGFPFVVDYAAHKKARDAEEEAYRSYCADALKAIAKNTAQLSGGEYLPKRYGELIRGDEKPQENPDEVINRVKESLGKMGGEIDGEFA